MPEKELAPEVLEAMVDPPTAPEMMEPPVTETGAAAYRSLAREEERVRAQIRHEEGMNAKVFTLADEMLDEALEIVRSRLGEDGDKAGVKKKMYALGVLDKTTRLLQGNEKLKLERKGAAVNEANFIMDMLRKAKSGELKSEEVASVRSAIAGQPDE